MGVGDGSSSSSSWRSEGCRSTGATMSVTTPASSSCCCINIYVNNNVQGVTNSVLVGSNVVMRDPGPRVVSSRHPPRAGFCQGKQQQQQKTTMWAAATAAMVCLAIIALRCWV